MNKERRKQIAEAVDLINQALEIIEVTKDEEETAYYNLPDSIQSGMRGEEMQEYLSQMEEASSSLEDAADILGEI